MSGEPCITILDGPLGSVLERRGYALPPPAWSAHAVRDHPDAISQVHAEYAACGATVHTACTFRTRARNAGRDWAQLAEVAVQTARNSVPSHHRVAGSVAPLESCYRPDLSPAHARGEHRDLARVLSALRVDLLLCESFPNTDEALVAVEECVATGVETWVSFCAGPDADLLAQQELERGAVQAVKRGAAAVLINCTGVRHITGYLQALAQAGVPFGAYANAGAAADGIGWGSGPAGAHCYGEFAREWVENGATIVGGCCGTDASHISVLSSLFSSRHERIP